MVMVPLNQPEIAAVTFASILEQAQLTYDEFLDCARIKTKGCKRKQ